MENLEKKEVAEFCKEHGWAIKEVHISQINAGDLIICKDGFIRTVGGKDIRFSTFMGITIFGDCYKLGYELVKKIEKNRNYECK